MYIIFCTPCTHRLYTRRHSLYSSTLFLMNKLQLNIEILSVPPSSVYVYTMPFHLLLLLHDQRVLEQNRHVRTSVHARRRERTSPPSDFDKFSGISIILLEGGVALGKNRHSIKTHCLISHCVCGHGEGVDEPELRGHLTKGQHNPNSRGGRSRDKQTLSAEHGSGTVRREKHPSMGLAQRDRGAVN